MYKNKICYNRVYVLVKMLYFNKIQRFNIYKELIINKIYKITLKIVCFEGAVSSVLADFFQKSAKFTLTKRQKRSKNGHF